MKELRSEITIDATAESVWTALTDLASFQEWKPFMREASGVVAVGEKLKVYLKLPGGMGTTFKPRVLKVESNREFRWLGHLVIPGLFDGGHIFEIKPDGDSKCTLNQREECSGVLAPVMLLILGKATERGFSEMNQALKTRVEGER